MRYFAILALPLALAAQPADTEKVTQALISEIQQLRLAIERSTLLNARTQLAISQLQMQETAVARLSTQVNDSRASSLAARITALTERIRETEDRRAAAPADPTRRTMLDEEIRNMKAELAQFQAAETQRATREGEL